jgi:hypothetical protein
MLVIEKPRYNWNIVESGVEHHNPSVIEKKLCSFDQA